MAGPKVKKTPDIGEDSSTSSDSFLGEGDTGSTGGEIEREKLLAEYKKINTVEKSAREYADQKFKDIQSDIDAKIKEIRQELGRYADKQINIIETLAIFVALFTFVSIEFQVFRAYQHPQAIAGLTLILLGSLISFVTILDFILNVKLPYTKSISRQGMLSSALDQIGRLGGYQEKLELQISKRDTWGPGFTIRVLLVIIWLALICTGVLLFSNSALPEFQYNDGNDTKDSQPIIQIHNNIPNPKNTDTQQATESAL